MPLVSTEAIVDAAYAEGAAAPAFNVIALEHAQAISAAAHRMGCAAIMQVSQNAVDYHGGIEAVGAAMLAIAREASAPVAVHLDHATRPELVQHAVRLGFSSVMFDASELDYHRNVSHTAQVTRQCHAAGVWVEAELGEIGGKDGVHAPGVRTDPDEAAAFVAATGVDALAVAVGSSHAMLTRSAELDFDRIAELRQRLTVPLVLHGSSGVEDAALARAVSSGLTKINIATQLNKILTEATRQWSNDHPDSVDPRGYLGHGREAMTEEVQRLMTAVGAVQRVPGCVSGDLEVGPAASGRS